MSVSTAPPLMAAGMKEGENKGGAGGAILPDALAAISRAAAICASVGIPADPTFDAAVKFSISPKTPLKVFYKSNKEVSENPYRDSVAITASGLPSALGISGAYQSRYAYTCTRFYKEPPAKPCPFVENMMQQGRKYEPVILKTLKRIYSKEYYFTSSGFLLDTVCPTLLGASPDGLVFDAKTTAFVGPLEIKYRDRAQISAIPEQIPLKYLIQIAAQLMCTVSNTFLYAEGKDEGPARGFRISVFRGTVDKRLFSEIRGMLLEYLQIVAANEKDTFPKRISGMPKDEHYRNAFKINRIY